MQESDPRCRSSSTTSRHLQAGKEQFRDHLDSPPPPAICGMTNFRTHTSGLPFKPRMVPSERKGLSLTTILRSVIFITSAISLAVRPAASHRPKRHQFQRHRSSLTPSTRYAVSVSSPRNCEVPQATISLSDSWATILALGFGGRTLSLGHCPHSSRRQAQI